MDPILQRFGDVTIQRLEKPKDEANSDTEVSPLKRQSNSATTSQINKRFKYDSNILENELDNFSDFDSSSEEEPDELSESETDFFTEKGEEDEVGEEEENFDFDIKAKLKEMGEISFQTVKKGEKPKKNEITSENEVSVTATKKQSTSEEDRKGVNMRRNIREVMDETKLDETTLAAQRLEAERLRRVQEQQRLLRELQRQAERDRMQDKVISLLQGGASCSKNTNNSFLNSKNSIPNSILTSNTTRIGNTVLVKLPNGQTKPMTRLPKRPFDLVRLQKTPPQAPIKRSGSFNLSPSISIAPVGKKVEPNRMPITHSDSDSDGEGMKMASMEQNQKAKPKQVALPVPTIDISSDDDCIVVSEPEGDNDEPEEDPSNSGMHTNDEFNQPDEQGRVVVNVGHLDDEGDVFVAPQIARIIKPHQIGGVRFLYDNVIESTSRFENSSGFGCILAHSMGLGKTLQIVCFSDIFLRHTPAQTILCIMPINTLQNWMAEFNMWLPTEQGAAALQKSTDANYDVRPRNFNLHVLNDSHKTLMARSKVIRAWRTGGGVLLIGYEQFRLLSLKKHPKSRRKNAMAMGEDDKNKIMFDEIHTALVNPGPDLVICDEGHRIKNSHASISQALKQMLTKRRIVLTGYPLQNNLMEYWCMVDFVRPNYLGSKTEFCNMFERPIMNGQCIDSTQTDIKLMRYRAHVLHSLLVGFVQRRSHSVLQIALPKKHEFVLLVRMTPFQRTLYETFMNEVVRIQAVPNPLKAFAVCCKIWNHPDVLYNFLKKRAKGDAVDLDLEEVGGTRTKKVSNKCESDARKPEASVGPYFDNTTEGSCASINKLSAKMEDRKPEALVPPFPFGDFYEDKKKINIISDIKLPKINILSDIKIEPKKEEEDIKSEVKLERLVPVKDSKEDCGIPYDWAYELLQNYTPGCIENSAKMRILFCIVNESIALGDRLLVFSQSLITLDLIEQFLQNTHLPNNPTTNWARNFSYFRLDGSTSALEREKLINEFNSNKNIHLFLVSTRAGSLGINLIGANRVVVLDASWNPCHDTQAVCRVYRYGQKKPCYVYRLVVDNCLEKKIYDRQINKQGMSDRVVDECNPDAHLTLKDVSSLCWDEKYDDNAQEELDFTNAHAQCCDKVLQKVLSGHGTMLNKAPFQHESLLVDRKEKQLSQQEKRLAKKGYEREKQAAGGAAAARNAVRPIASVRPMQHGPNRWIPAEHWQRQGMTAQEMTLPLDVVIPTTNQPEKGNIVLKAGQKVLVLKSPKGVYMQLESGKIVAIKTAIKVKGELRKLPPPTRVVKPFQAKFNVKSIKQAVPNLDPVQSMRNIKKNSSSSSEEEEDQNSNLEKLARATSAAESSGFQVTLNSITQQQGDKVPEPETEFLPVDIKSEAPDYVNYNASSAGGYYNNYNYPPPPQQNYVYQQPQAAPPYEMMTYQHPAPPPQSQVPPIPPIYNNYNYQSYQTYAPPPPPPPQNYDYGPPPTQNIYHPPPVYHHNPYTQQPYAQVPPLQAPAAPPPQMYPQMPSAPQHYNTDYQYQPTPPSQIQPPPSLPQNIGSGYYSNA